MATTPLDIVIKTIGADKAGESIRALGTTAQTTQKSIDSGISPALKTATSLLKGFAVAAAAAFSIEAIVDIGDRYNVLSQRIASLSKDATEYANIQDRLFATAQKTRAPLEATSNLFVRLKQTTAGANVTTDQLLKTTETLNELFTISGASAQAIDSAVIQLGQGLGNGALRGEEFNSVMEATNGAFGRALKASGLFQGDLRALAEQGAITGQKIVQALVKVGPDIEKVFAGIPPTVSGAFTQLQNVIFQFVGQLNQSTGFTTILATAISAVATALQAATPLLITFGGALTGLLVVGSITAAFAALPVVIGLVTTALQGLVAFTGPIGILAAAAGALIAYFAQSGVAIGSFGGQAITVGGAIKATWGVVVETFNVLFSTFRFLGESITNFINGFLPQGQQFASIWDVIAAAIKRARDFVVQFIEGLPDFVQKATGLDKFAAALKNFESNAAAASKTTTVYGQALDKTTNSTNGLAKASNSAAKAVNNLGQEIGKGAAILNQYGEQIGTVGEFEDQWKQRQADLYKRLGLTQDSLGVYRDTANDAASSNGNLANSFGNAASAAYSAADAYDSAASSARNYSQNAGSGPGTSSIDPNGLLSGKATNGQALGGSFQSYRGPNGEALTRDQYNAGVAYSQILQDTLPSLFDRAGAGDKTAQAQLSALIAKAKRGTSAQDAALNNALLQYTGQYYAKIGDVANAQKYQELYLEAMKRSTGFASGGSFTVGGKAGRDANLVPLALTKGERVTVETKRQQRMGGGQNISINFEVKTPDADSFRKSQTQISQALVEKLGRDLADV